MATKQTKKPKAPKLSQTVKTDSGTKAPPVPVTPPPSSTPVIPATSEANTQTLVHPRTPAPGSNNDISQIFQGIKNSRSMVRRDLSGNIMSDNQSGGSALDNFFKKNPHLNNPQAANNDYIKLLNNRAQAGAAAVDFVKQTKGYTDADGRFVPPTLPSNPTSASGTGSVSSAPRTGPAMTTDPLTGQKVPLNQLIADMKATQATKGINPDTGAQMSPQEIAAAQSNYFNPSKGQSSPSGIDQLFPGKSSPPSGGNAGPVATAAPMGPLGGDFQTPFTGKSWLTGAGKMEPNADTQLGVNPQLPPNAGPQNQPYVAGNYDYLYPGMIFPATGTLAQKEMARRAALPIQEGLFGQFSNAVEKNATAMENTLQQALYKLFGQPSYAAPVSDLLKNR